MTIDNRKIGSTTPPYIIAELSANHDGSLEKALQIIEEAKKAGADAVKLQTYTADTITINHDSDDFCIKGGLWDGYTLYQLYEEAHTPWEWHHALFEKCRDLDISIFSSPFDETAVDFLEDLGCPAYKIASFEVIDLPLIRKVASTGKPMIISSGMANVTEIQEAIDTARENGCHELILLHCISGYPSPPEEANLLTIKDMQKQFDVPIGLSDHTLGTSVSIAATALGAVAIEKHFTLNRSDGGPDSSFSLEPGELKTLCDDTRTAWLALGKAGYDLKDSEKGNIQFRRSLYFVKDMKAGDVIRNDSFRSVRPGYGLPPKFADQIIGKSLIEDVQKFTPVTLNKIGSL